MECLPQATRAAIAGAWRCAGQHEVEINRPPGPHATLSLAKGPQAKRRARRACNLEIDSTDYVTLRGCLRGATNKATQPRRDGEPGQQEGGPAREGVSVCVGARDLGVRQRLVRRWSFLADDATEQQRFVRALARNGVLRTEGCAVH